MSTTTTTTIAVEQGDRAVAWRMIAPSASGGKVYSIAINGTAVATCWGRARTAGPSGAGAQGRVARYRTPGEAFAAAQQATLSKEGAGYSLDIPPRTVTAPASTTLPVTDAVGMVLRDGSPV